jgi:type IX secretion system PorP/SprF family membrane protein
MQKNRYIKECLILLNLLLGFVVMAQQEAQYTHYMHNTLAVNPAYAGSRDALTFAALNRSQWLGFKDAPHTQTFTMHGPAFKERAGLGLSLINDKIGPIRNTSVFIDFSYSIKLNSKSKLALGLKSGGSLFQAKLSSVETNTKGDVAFQNNISNVFMPNFGFGVYYHTQRFYAGVSSPKLLKNKFTSSVNNTSVVLNPENIHMFFIAGAMLDISKELQFKPTCYIKATENAPIEADVTATFIIQEKISLGGAYRTADAAALLLGYQINGQLYAGYSFDWSMGVKTFTTNFGSHEIMLRYDFIYKDKRNISSPRYF